MRYPLYFTLHLTGVLLVFSVLAIIAFLVWNGETRQTINRRKFLASFHGLGMFLILLGGFGLMKVMGISHTGGYPSYLIIKAIIWLVLGAGTLFIYKLPKLAPYLLLIFIFLGVAAAYSGKFKREFFNTSSASNTELPVTKFNG